MVISGFGLDQTRETFILHSEPECRFDLNMGNRINWYDATHDGSDPHMTQDTAPCTMLTTPTMPREV